MSVEAIAPIGADTAVTSAISPTASATPTADFMGIVFTQMAGVDASLRTAETQLAQLAAGKDIAIHDVMIAMEEARTNLLLLVEVRNRVIEAYQELTRMQL